MVTDAPISAGIVESFIGRIGDRRKRQRLVVQWPLRLWRNGEHIVDTFTVNVSSGGFYCICRQRFSPGETLLALLEIPKPGTDRESSKIVLCCEALVLRVEIVADTGDFGIACRIVTYSVFRPKSAALTVESARS